MQTDDTIRRVAVVGTGLIGSSWAAHFLARGLEVAATDPRPGAEGELTSYIDRVWPVLTQLGLSPGASRDRLRFTADLKAAVTGVDFVQESGPERVEFKVKMFADLDAMLPPAVILASSSSGLTMSAIQAGCSHPERCVIGHPFNPPHLIPLVEVVGGKATSLETVERAEKFYTRMGKRTIRLNKEVAGHVANRLQAALWREAVHLVAEGVVSVADVDAAVSCGPGLRWGVMGPNLIFHLGGGQGGMAQFMNHLAGPVSRWWQDLGQPVLSPEVQRMIIQGVREEAAGRSIVELEKERDQAIIGLLALRKDLI
ncbi:MAG: 3-hydroxyacyl-CoA dehydrogenase [Verrucomicrobia bacterium]|nr:3-hydroxyacyl-CoA dehydrogenase [Verrucomicrobiota bacterium]